jgi:prepilin-type processing-associated H-X9-DG protein
MMLNYLEQNAIYNAINFNFAVAYTGQPSSLINATAYNNKIASFLCPSDGYAGKTNINSYHASIGTTTFNCCSNPGAVQTTGVFGYARGSAIEEITDGTTNTIAYSEALVGASPGFYAGNSTGNVPSAGASNQRDVSTLTNAQALLLSDINTCNTAFLTGTPEGGRGNHWGTGAMGYTMFNTVIPPNYTKWSACRMDCCAQAEHAHYQVANSNHSGGVNVLMSDGSVKFIKNSINWGVWWALGTRANSETIPADAY